jgi:hypothetical protein
MEISSMSRKTKLALPIAVALGIAALPVAASASRDGGNYDRDSDWGYWSANNNAQVSTQLKRENGSTAFSYSQSRAHKKHVAAH